MLRMMKISFTILLILTFNIHHSFTQSILRIRIHGRVVDASTGEPLHFVNVFLSNTTKGAATDKDGTFTIVNVPLGTYELVVTMMGYEFETQKIQLKGATDHEYNFRLYPRALETPEIEISAPHPREWKKNLRKFKKLLLGSSENAIQCKMINPEILDFNFDKTSHVFTAMSRQPLQIENRALGYRITLFLEDFSARENDYVRLLYKSRFEFLPPKNEKEEKKWEERRIKAYLGSIRHFFAALASGKLEEEGFLTTIGPQIRKKNDNRKLRKVSVNDLLSPGESPFEKKLSFPGYLKVVYTREKEQGRYSTWNRDNKQTSWLKIDVNQNVTITLSGYVNHPYAISKYGYWAWERFAEELPLDYSPLGSGFRWADVTDRFTGNW